MTDRTEPARVDNQFDGTTHAAFQGRDVHGDVIIRTQVPNPRSTPLTITLEFLIPVLVAEVLAGASNLWHNEEAGTPVAVEPQLLTTQQLHHDCRPRHVEGTPQGVDVEAIWTSNQHAVLTDGQIDLTLQNPSAREILLMEIDVNILQRTSPPRTGFFMTAGLGCGAPIPPRTFSVELDSTPPRLAPLIYPENASTQGSFPYEVHQGEPEVFKLYFTEVADYVEFEFILDVVIDGKRQEITLDNDGQPYRLTGMGDLPRYDVVDGMNGPSKWLLVPHVER